MMRFSTLSAIVLTGAFVTLIVNIQTPDPQDAGAVPDGQYNRNIQELSISYGCFKQTFTSALDGLLSGEYGLEEARDRVHESAQSHFPNYLKHIEITDPAPTVQQRIARNLMGHLHNIDDPDGKLASRLRVLDAEFAAIKGRGTVTKR
jgi:hypothetical protein